MKTFQEMSESEIMKRLRNNQENTSSDEYIEAMNWLEDEVSIMETLFMEGYSEAACERAIENLKTDEFLMDVVEKKGYIPLICFAVLVKLQREENRNIIHKKLDKWCNVLDSMYNKNDEI